MALEYGKNASKVFDKKIIIVMILLFIVYIRHIGSDGLFTILDDEFGYWGNAAYFVGLDWSDTISIIPYYSYGYSLILAPIFLIIGDPMLMYKAAILLNGVMLVASFYLCFDISKKLSPSTDNRILLVISLVVFMYPSYIAYSNIAWSECLLVFIFWLLTWCYCNLDKHYTDTGLILIGVLSTYIYTIHQRTVGILIASILTFLFMKISGKISYKQFISALIPVAILMFAHISIKADIQENLWLNEMGSLINDYSRELVKVKSLLTVNGLTSAGKVFLGQWYSLGVTSFLIFYYGIFELVSSFGRTLGVSFRREKDHDAGLSYLNLFLFLSVLLSLAISAISMMNPSRIDQLVYTRYVDIVVGPVILLGFLKLQNYKRFTTWKYLTIIMFFGLYSYVIHLIIESYSLSLFCPQHCVGMIWMHTSLKLLVPFILCSIGYLLLVKSIKLHRMFILSTFIIGLFFFITGETVFSSVSSSGVPEIEMTAVTDVIKSYDDATPVYFLWDEHLTSTDYEWKKLEASTRYYPEYYQYLLKDRRVIFADREELNSLSFERLVITVGTADQLGLIGEYIFLEYALESNLYYYKAHSKKTN